jgi:ribosomal-protein-alanine N-acetyltransferase
LSEIPSDDSFFDFKCPYCGEVNSFPTTAAHTLQDCASCMESVVVPAVGVQIGGKLPLPITTPRLLLRKFHRDDSVRLLAMLAQDESDRLPVDETDVDQWIERQRAARFVHNEFGVHLAIELVESQELVGHVLLHSLAGDRHDGSFSSLTITPPRRRQGLGSEAARAALDFAFDGLCVRRVAVSCPSANAAARGMLAKAGLRQEGELVKSWFDGITWVNVSLYALLKEERAARP